MKIGIVTLFGDNYGNKLQNYAVQEILKHEFNSEVETIIVSNGDSCYHQETIFEKIYKLRPLNIIKFIQRKLTKKTSVTKDAISLRKASFQNFTDRFLQVADFEIDARFDDYDNRLDSFDYFFTGSDQVWNRTKAPYFLQFAPVEKRCAFAPSFGIDKLPSYLKVDYKKWISEIPYLSVREEQGAKIIKKLTGRDAKIIIDPTMCLTKEKWQEIERKPDYCHDEEFVLTYFLGDKDKVRTDYIKTFTSTHRLKLIDLNNSDSFIYYAADPSEFLWLIYNCKILFTDSFHGTVFSIIFNKPFVVFDRMENGYKTQGSRIDTLLKTTGLENRKISHIDKKNIFYVDFSFANKALEEKRAEAIDFLRNVITRESHNIVPIPSLPSKHSCTGCGACFNVCPTSAISMDRDEEGFAYPIIDSEKCINCRACERACPADKAVSKVGKTLAYYAYSKDEYVCKNSSSGGLFTELAKAVLDQQGVVFGVGYDERFNVKHIKVISINDLDRIRTSKYVQSDTTTIYKEVKTELLLGKKVLFSGTPCQIAALKSFLGKEYKNLFTVDIICHGVPSPEIWERYLKENHLKKDVESISFRDKTVGWNDFSMKVSYKDGTAYRKLATKDPFERAFLSNISLRPSCYQCQYKTVERISDITLADYWGVEVVHPELKGQEGVSLVLIHSKAGEELLEYIKNSIVFGNTDLERAVKMNSACCNSVAWPNERNLFFDMLSKFSVKDATRRSLKPTMTKRIKRFIVINGSRIKKLFKKFR